MAPRFLTLLALLPLVFAKVEVPQPAMPEDANGECRTLVHVDGANANPQPRPSPPTST